MKGTDIKAILFDFDGTLATLNIDFHSMREEIMALIDSYTANSDGFGNLYVLEMIKAGREAIGHHHISEGKAFERRALALVRGIEMEAAKKGGLMEGIEVMLKGLREKGIRAGIVTRNCLDAVQEIFPDVHDYCDAVITREFTERVKPHPDHLRVALDSLDTLPGNAAMVGDHPMDMAAGKEVGTYAIGVLTGYSKEAALLAAGADMIIESSAIILDYIGQC